MFTDNVTGTGKPFYRIVLKVRFIKLQFYRGLSFFELSLKSLSIVTALILKKILFYHNTGMYGS
jgi:hypothetical protein